MKAEEIREGKVKLESEEYSKYQVRKATITEGPQYMGQYKAKMLNCKLEDYQRTTVTAGSVKLLY